MVWTGKSVCNVCKVEKCNICRKIKYTFYKYTIISAFYTDAKMTKNPTTNVLIIIYILFFFGSHVSYCFICLCFCVGHKNDNKQMKQCGGSHGKAWHIWDEISFLFSPFILLSVSCFFFIPTFAIWLRGLFVFE